MGIDVLMLQAEKGGDLAAVLASQKKRFASEELVNDVLALYKKWTAGEPPLTRDPDDADDARSLTSRSRPQSTLSATRRRRTSTQSRRRSASSGRYGNAAGMLDDAGGELTPGAFLPAEQGGRDGAAG